MIHMSITKTKEKVRDGYLGDLPEDLQKKVMDIHKLIKDTVYDLIEDSNYEDLKESRWAMTCIEDFCIMPADKSEVGSIRVYKNGKRYRCMIQATGHFRNHQYGWIEELLHDFICNVYSTVRPKVRRTYDMTITNEGRTGEPYEGFDIYPNPKSVKDIWDSLNDRKTKTITEDVDEIACSYDIADYYELYKNMSYDNFFHERSHGKLKNSFRIGVNPENGHFIKIVFDLDPSSISQVGDHANQDRRNLTRDREIANNITKTGHNDFSSRGMVKAIVDMDTKKNLQSVKTIGVIGSNSNTTRFTVPDEFIDPSLGPDESTTFSAYPVSTREKIAKKLKLNPPDAITFKVGEMEKVPSYKATIAAKSISALYNNQWRKGRGVSSSTKMSQRINSDMDINKAINDIERRYNSVKSLLDMSNDDVKFYVKFFDKSINKIRQVMNSNKGDNFGQTVSDPRYNAIYTRLEEALGELEDMMKHVDHGGINGLAESFQYGNDLYERSHGLLKSSFRMGINKENGHLIKLVFDLNPKDITLVGSHDDTHPIPDEEQDEIAKNIRKTGFTDFASTGVCKAIVDMDTGEKLQTVKCVGIMNGYAPFAKRPLKVREQEIADGTKFYGAKTYTVGKSEDPGNERKRRLMATYKTTKAPRSVDDLHNVVNGHRQGRGYVKEATSAPEYNVDMTETEAKKTLRILSQNIINDTINKSGYKVSQYTANIYANIITKNLLPLWAKGFRKFSIQLDTYQSFHTLEFKIPTITQDFVSRFVNGRESINGFIHRQSEIKIKMSPRIFHTMKNPDDAYRFFKSAIKYYDGGLEKAGLKMMVEVMRLNTEMKHLVSTTKLSGIVTYPLTLLFKFDDVHMDNIDTFRITSDDINTVNKFIRSIYTRYAAPEKEKKRIVEDVKDMVKALRESADTSDENIRNLSQFSEAVEQYIFGGFDKNMAEVRDRWVYEQLDTDWTNRQTNGKLKYMQEAFGVKKLKKIPADLVAYISIEADAIRDANDKMMISSYCLSKIEIVEWYIELLDVGSKKYIVPHTKPYLESVRTQLLACFKKIMDTPIPKADRPLIDINYPKGYEG